MTDLPKPLVEAIEAIVRTYRDAAPASSDGRRTIGWARDVLPELPTTFFDPLPDDVMKNHVSE